MKNEDMLLQLIRGAIHGIEMNLECIKNLPEIVEIPGFDDGKICGLAIARNAMLASLRIYDRWLKGELPDEMTERLEHHEPQ